MKIHAVIVTYNGGRWIRRCLNSLLIGEMIDTIYVIDNGSVDDTVSIIRNEFNTVQLIIPGTNLGFGQANNLGIQKALTAGADFVWLMNQDAWLLHRSIEHLVSVALASKGFGIWSPLHLTASEDALDYNFSQQISVENCPDLFSDAMLNRMRPIYTVKFVNAAAWLVSRDCFRTVGLFDPNFFMYGEDNNFVQRAQYFGYDLGVVPGCSIVHDRAERQGKPNAVGIKNQKRVFTLIVLLDINMPLRTGLYHFFRARMQEFFRFFKVRNKWVHFKTECTEYIFLVKNFSKIKKNRNSNQQRRE